MNRAIQLVRKLYLDERGMLASAEMIIVATIVMLGAIVGISTLRDSIVQEFGDGAAAISKLQQGYSYNAHVGFQFIGRAQILYAVPGSDYVDNRNFCEPALPDPANAEPMCMQIDQQEPLNEGDQLPGP